MSGTTDSEEQAPRSGSSFVVCKFFGFTATDVNQEQIKCEECCRVVSALQGNTNNLFNRLKRHDKLQYN